VVTLQSDAKRHLSSVDEQAGQLVAGLSTLQGSIDHIEGRVEKLEAERMDAFLDAVSGLRASIDRIELNVEKLESLEEAITLRIDGLRGDLNARMIAVEHTVAAMNSPMQEMADDVAKIDELLPDPKDGPLTRLKDTLTSS
jgi:chaperonin cofactor prefoldin